MKRVHKAYYFLRDKYELLTMKKYTTLAGTLVFFLLMSIVPFTFWLTLLIGKLPIDTGEILDLPVFSSVKNILSYVQQEAQTATTGASVLLLVTTLYSATNFFYQMRRSGEIIYEFHRKRQGIKLRITALILMFLVMILVVCFLLVTALGAFLFSRYFSGAVGRIAEYILLIALCFLLVLLLNAYICPYKRPLKDFLVGTTLTVLAWVLAVVGFGVYLKISNVDKLYGALSAVIVFLLWLYILTLCFVAGVIFNGESVLKKHKKSPL